MFLDDELLQLGRQGHPNKNSRKLEKIETEMILACMKNLDVRVSNTKSSDVLVANFKRVDNTWKKVVHKLIPEGFTFTKPELFQAYIEGTGDFKKLCPLIWGKNHG